MSTRTENGVSATCDRLTTLLESLHHLKTAATPPSAQELSAVVAKCGLHFVDLKRQVRETYMNVALAGEETVLAKDKADRMELQLKNLLYEKLHLLQEIRKCQQFQSRHETLGMLSEAEFMAAGPADTSALAAGDPHKLMLARIDWELKQRQELEKQLEQLKSERAAKEKRNETKSGLVETLPKQLNALLEAARPIEQLFGGSATLLTHDSPAHLLPAPLYTLFMHIAAYRAANDDALTVDVEGDTAAALDVNAANPWKNIGAKTAEEESGSARDNDDDNGAATADRLQARVAAHQALLLTPYPLQVRLSLPCGNNVTARITFTLYPGLDLVTPALAVTGAAVALPADTLAHLYPGDVGDELPNPVNLFKMDALKMKPFGEYLPQIGRPYRWVQALSGLSTAGLVVHASSADTSADAAQRQRSALVQVLAAVRVRIKSRISLANQFSSFGQGHIVVPESAADFFPLKATAKLVSWSQADLHGPAEAFAAASHFKAVFKRDSTVLVARIKITAAYPLEAPTFSLSFDNASLLTDNNLKAMEAEVNVFLGDFAAIDSTSLLTLQLRRLQMCFDIYMEVEDDLDASASASKARSASGFGKLFVRGIRGRDRVRPFCFDAVKGYFVHRDELRSNAHVTF